MTSFVEFAELPEPRLKTKVWEARTTAEHGNLILGRIRWRASWRRYVFHPEDDSLFDAGCLREIAVFLDARMGERRVLGAALR